MADTAVPAPPPTGYPVAMGVGPDPTVARWRPLVHWLMVIPQAIVAGVLVWIASILAFVSWFIVLVTARLPEGLARFQVMALRYQFRVTGFALGLTEQYPPFTFDTVVDDPGDHEIVVAVRPELEGRSRLSVAFRFLLLIPLQLVWIVYAIGAFFVGAIAWFAVLFTGTYPVGLRMLMVGLEQYLLRVTVYGHLLVDDYPPFGVDADNKADPAAI